MFMVVVVGVRCEWCVGSMLEVCGICNLLEVCGGG